MDSPFMEGIASRLGGRELRVVRFEFPYMSARRAGGPRRAPDPRGLLESSWLDVIERLGGGAGLVIGGKSLGGRIASMVADGAGVRGLVCLGYPFHPPGKPAQLRTAHLGALLTPAILVQGTRDPFGTREEVAAYGLSPRIRLAWIEEGDHSFARPKRSALAREDSLDAAAGFVREFLTELARQRDAAPSPRGAGR